MPVLFPILVMLWFAWCVAAVLAVLSVRKFARRYGHRPRRTHQAYRPPAVVIVPFKGIDLDLAETVANLCNQDYPDYRLLCVVESQDDPACPLLREQLARHPHRAAQLLIAGPAPSNEGQKVHNLRCAIEALERETADPHAAAHEVVWVFADSDAVPGPHWLGELVGPLRQHWMTGITTGYRWMIPPADGGLADAFWSHAASVINSSVACFYGYDRFNHAWGGSMAMRRSTALEGDFVGHLRGALSDDYQATRMCRLLRQRVYFVPRCLVASSVDYDRRTFFNFARRQYVITRTHAAGLYYGVLAIQLLYFAGYVSAAGVLIVSPLAGMHRLAPWPLAAMLVVLVANQFRAVYRRQAVRSAFGEPMLRQLRWPLWLDRWATPLWMTLHLSVVLSALVGRTIAWRGRRYRIHAPQRVEELGGSE